MQMFLMANYYLLGVLTVTDYCLSLKCYWEKTVWIDFLFQINSDLWPLLGFGPVKSLFCYYNVYHIIRCVEGFLFPVKEEHDCVKPVVISALKKEKYFILLNRDVVEVIEATEDLIVFRFCLVANFYSINGVDSSAIDDYQFIR